MEDFPIILELATFLWFEPRIPVLDSQNPWLRFLGLEQLAIILGVCRIPLCLVRCGPCMQWDVFTENTVVLLIKYMHVPFAF